MRKTKFMAVFLALVMMFSVVMTSGAAAVPPPERKAITPCPTTNTTYGGDPYAPVVLDTGTVVVEDCSTSKLIHVFMDSKTVVTMDETFVLDYTSTAYYKDRSFSSRNGYSWLAEAAIERALRDKSITRASDGKSLNYGVKVITLSTASGEPLALDYMITNFFRQPVTKIRTLDTVTYTLTYRNGDKRSSCITVRSYGDEILPAEPDEVPSAYCDIWAVRDVDKNTIEVYLRSGMIVTLSKAMIIDWVDNRQNLGRTFGLNSWHDWREMDDEGAEICVDFCQALLDNLILQGWTMFPEEALESGYTYKAFPAKDVLWTNATSGKVLTRSMERMRNDDTTAEVTINFNYSNRYGKWLSTTPYLVCFEFICRDNDAKGGYTFYSLTQPEYFAWSFDASQSVWLTDKEIGKLKK